MVNAEWLVEGLEMIDTYLRPSSLHKLTSSGFFFLESHMDMVR